MEVKQRTRIAVLAVLLAAVVSLAASSMAGAYWRSWGPLPAPTLSVSGEVLSWNRVGWANEYEILRNMPGRQSNVFFAHDRLSVSAWGEPCHTFGYKVRAAWHGEWSNEVHVTYPCHHKKHHEEPEETREEKEKHEKEHKESEEKQHEEEIKHKEEQEHKKAEEEKQKELEAKEKETKEREAKEKQEKESKEHEEEEKSEEPEEEPPVEEEKPVEGIVWKADGEAGGPTNNPFKEWAAYSGAEFNSGNKHSRIQLLPESEGVKPEQGKYLYRYELKPGRNAFDNERLEMLNEQQSYDPQEVPLSKLQYHEGDDVWIAFAVRFPFIVNNEVSWSENTHGVVPIWQFHGQGGAVPSVGAGVVGTRPGFTPEIKSATFPGWNTFWSEKLKLNVWYKEVYHIHISKSSSLGLVEFWVDNENGEGLIKKASLHYATLDSSFMFAAQGGPRNENGPQQPEPPEQTEFFDGWTFGSNKEAVVSNAFGGNP